MSKKNMKSKNKAAIAARDLMIAIAVKHGGDWNKIYKTIENRDWFPDEDELKETVAREQNYLYSDRRGTILCLMDPDYPKILRATLAKPPFVLFIKDGRASTVPFSQQGIAAIKVPCPEEAKERSGLWEFDEDGDAIDDPTVAKGTVNIEIEYADLSGLRLPTQGILQPDGRLHREIRGRVLLGRLGEGAPPRARHPLVRPHMKGEVK